jgi:hypothetical protein
VAATTISSTGLAAIRKDSRAVRVRNADRREAP